MPICEGCGAEFIEGWNRHRYCSFACRNKVRTNPVALRFFRFVEMTPGCWQWRGSLSQGYGRFIVRTENRGAHRVSFELHKGLIPEGYDVHHICRNKRCVNPDHLEILTHKEHCQMGEQGEYNRVKTHCPKGHEYTPENTYLGKRKNNRTCRECSRTRDRERKRNLRRSRKLIRDLAQEGPVS